MGYEYTPVPPRRPFRPLARARIVKSVLFACGSRIAARNGGWIDNLAMNDILGEAGASSGTLDKLVDLGLIERRRVAHPGMRRQVSEWRAGPDAQRWLANQKDVGDLG
jgi:hypothetical protein